MYFLLHILIIILCAFVIGRVSTVFTPCKLPAISQCLFGCGEEEDVFVDDVPGHQAEIVR